MEVDEDADAFFKCELSDADASILWYKNGRVLEKSDRTIILEKGTERQLIIKCVKPEDSGDYECVTTDGRSKAFGILCVKGHLEFLLLKAKVLTSLKRSKNLNK